MQGEENALSQKHRRLIADLTNAPMDLTNSGEAPQSAEVVLALSELDSDGQAEFNKMTPSSTCGGRR